MEAVEAPLRVWLLQQFPDSRVLTRLPPQFEAGEMPVIQIRRTGGPRSLILDNPFVQIETFGTDEEAASDLIQAIDDALNYKLPTLVATATASYVLGLKGTYSGPSRRSADDSNLWSFGATYGLLLHAA